MRAQLCFGLLALLFVLIESAGEKKSVSRLRHGRSLPHLGKDDQKHQLASKVAPWPPTPPKQIGPKDQGPKAKEPMPPPPKTKGPLPKGKIPPKASKAKGAKVTALQASQLWDDNDGFYNHWTWGVHSSLATEPPTKAPTMPPVKPPTYPPTWPPTKPPTKPPTAVPTLRAVTLQPSASENVITVPPVTLPPLPTLMPSAQPSTIASSAPTPLVATAVPSKLPTATPSGSPSQMPVPAPSMRPISPGPTLSPASTTPSKQPAAATSSPSQMPAQTPTVMPTNPLSLYDIIKNNPIFQILLQAVNAGNFGSILGDIMSGPFTVFAPTSFGALGSYAPSLLMPEYNIQLTDLILNHITLGKFYAANLTNGLELTMANNQKINVSRINNTIELITSAVEAGDEQPVIVQNSDVVASNGILHITEEVILPRWFFFNPGTIVTSLAKFSTVNRYLNLTGLSETFAQLSNTTIALPDDNAFAALPTETQSFLNNPSNIPTLKEILEYHILTKMLPYTDVNLKSQNVTTVEGEAVSLIVSTAAGSGVNLSFNNVSVVGSGVYVTKENLIYEIGGVLIPPSLVGIIPPYSVQMSMPPSLAPISSNSSSTNGTLPPISSNSSNAPLIQLLLSNVSSASNFTVSLTTAGLGVVLANTTGRYTLFAVSNDALTNELGSYWATLQTPPYELHLKLLLENHITQPIILSNNLTDGRLLTMLSGNKVAVQHNSSHIYLLTQPIVAGYVPPAMITEADLKASNGIIDVVDSVIMPDFVYLDPIDAIGEVSDTFTTLLDLISRANLTDVFRAESGKTILAPDSTAFKALSNTTIAYLTDPVNVNVLREVLLYHVLIEIMPYLSNSYPSQNVSSIIGQKVAVETVGTGVSGMIFNGIPAVNYFLSKEDLIYEIGSVLIPPTLASVIPR